MDKTPSAAGAPEISPARELGEHLGIAPRVTLECED
jgi:hypothetical protein